MEPGQTYMDSMSYENFIRRAFKCHRGEKGAENAYFKILLDADNGSNLLGNKYDKRFADVKKFTLNAVDKYLKSKPTVTEQSHLIQLRANIENSPNATVLLEYLKYGLQVTERYRTL